MDEQTFKRIVFWTMVLILVVVILAMVGQASGQEPGPVVKGRILFTGQAPAPDAFRVGLCNMTEDGDWCIYNINPPAPKSSLQPDGSFEIQDVGPGWYGLVFEFSYYYQIMPHWPDGSGEILLEIDGQDLDLGDLDWDTWPCQLRPEFGCGTKLALPVIIN